MESVLFDLELNLDMVVRVAHHEFEHSEEVLI